MNKDQLMYNLILLSSANYVKPKGANQERMKKLIGLKRKIDIAKCRRFEVVRNNHRDGM